MARRPPKSPSRARAGNIDPLARALASAVQTGHGADQASTLDMSEETARPRGFVGTRNIALDRALGCKLPLGRITEVSGWPGAGKSTMLDQILAEVQADGGIAVLADTERTRNRDYMVQLGIDPASTVWIGGSTVEVMFDEIETLTRKLSHLNAVAWYEALKRAKVKVDKLKTYQHKVYDGVSDRAVASFQFAVWGRAQAAALMTYQQANKLAPSSVRDAVTRAKLRPCIVHTEDPAERKEALAAWNAGDAHPLVQPADRPVVIGWDSVAGTATEAEMEGDARKQHVATAAKVIRRNLRRLVQLIDDEAIGFVIVNQRYEKIQTGKPGFSNGPKSETYGGGGIKYHTTVRIEATRVGFIYAPGADKKVDAPMGQVVRIKVPKNKVNDPHHTEDYGLIYGRGADNAWAIYHDLLNRKIITTAGGWSKFADPSLGITKAFHGWTDLSNMMAENPDLWTSLSALYMQGRT